MMFSVTFGAFGDFVTAADLALRIAEALSSSYGSSYEYQYLIKEIDGLAHVLKLAEAATRTGMLPLEVITGILAEIERCREVLKGLMDRIHGYQKALGSKPGSSSPCSSWRKVGWALFMTQPVEQTRIKLSTHRTNLLTLMTACNLSSMAELKQQIASSEQRVQVQLNEINNAIARLPAQLGYSHATSIVVIQGRDGPSMLLPFSRHTHGPRLSSPPPVTSLH